eukprot:4893732-Pleurochrysis_carterae.AAC.1
MGAAAAARAGGNVRGEAAAGKAAGGDVRVAGGRPKGAAHWELPDATVATNGGFTAAAASDMAIVDTVEAALVAALAVDGAGTVGIRTGTQLSDAGA